MWSPPLVTFRRSNVLELGDADGSEGGQGGLKRSLADARLIKGSRKSIQTAGSYCKGVHTFRARTDQDGMEERDYAPSFSTHSCQWLLHTYMYSFFLVTSQDKWSKILSRDDVTSEHDHYRFSPGSVSGMTPIGVGIVVRGLFWINPGGGM